MFSSQPTELNKYFFRKETFFFQDHTLSLINNFENSQEIELKENTVVNEDQIENFPSGVSMDNASYMENNVKTTDENINETFGLTESIIEEYTPKLFSEEQSPQENSEKEINKNADSDLEQLFDQDINEEEDFEIPAFLRKQKF